MPRRKQDLPMLPPELHQPLVLPKLHARSSLGFWKLTADQEAENQAAINAYSEEIVHRMLILCDAYGVERGQWFLLAMKLAGIVHHGLHPRVSNGRPPKLTQQSRDALERALALEVAKGHSKRNAARRLAERPEWKIPRRAEKSPPKDPGGYILARLKPQASRAKARAGKTRKQKGK